MNKQQRKDVRAVIYKYAGKSPTGSTARRVTSAFLIAGGVGIDLITTGGLGTVIALSLGGTGALTETLNEIFFIKGGTKEDWKNRAGQTIESRTWTICALRAIEDSLQETFKKVLNVEESPQLRAMYKEEFFALAKEALKDIETLSAAFNVVTGSGKILNTQYILSVSKPKSSGKSIITVAEAMELLNKPKASAPKQKQTNEIKALNKKVEALTEKVDDARKPKIIDIKKPSPGFFTGNAP